MITLIALNSFIFTLHLLQIINHRMIIELCYVQIIIKQPAHVIYNVQMPNQTPSSVSLQLLLKSHHYFQWHKLFNHIHKLQSWEKIVGTPYVIYCNYLYIYHKIENEA